MKDKDPVYEFVVANSSGIAIDIGGNQGLYTKIMMEKCREVHVFEPNSEMCDLLRAKFPSAFVTCAAVSDSERSDVEFHIDRRPGKGSVVSSFYRLVDVDDSVIETIRVPTIRLDDYVERHLLRPNFIKIDVEGHEPSVFAGAWNCIERYTPVIVFEFWETWIEKGYRQTFSRLENSYRLVRLQDGARISSDYQPMSPKRAVDIGCFPLVELKETG